MSAADQFAQYNLDNPQDREQLARYVKTRFDDLVDDLETRREQEQELMGDIEYRSLDEIEEDIDEEYDEDAACPVDAGPDDEYVEESMKVAMEGLTKTFDAIGENPERFEKSAEYDRDVDWDVTALFEVPYLIAAQKYSDEHGYDDLADTLDDYVDDLLTSPWHYEIPEEQTTDLELDIDTDILEDADEDQEIAALEWRVEQEQGEYSVETGAEIELELAKAGDLSPERVEDAIRDIADITYESQKELCTPDQGQDPAENPFLAPPEDAHELAQQETFTSLQNTISMFKDQITAEMP